MTDVAGTPAIPYGLVWALPFIGLLVTIGIAPLIAPRLWHRRHGAIVAAWAAVFLVPAAAAFGVRPALDQLLDTALHQYLPFMLMLGALYIIAGGLHLTGTLRGTPAVNTMLLAIGTLIASLVGTTGAALLMLRPLIRANRQRAQPTHVFVFFIILVANIGGALTPLGNPPLLLGYLKGVPFGWPLIHLAPATLVLTGGLLATFFALDHLLRRRRGEAAPAALAEIEKLGIVGRVNLLLLAAAVASLMLRSLWPSPLSLDFFGVSWRYTEIVADLMLAAAAAASLLLTPRRTRAANEFSWRPLGDVTVLFAALFVTLIPLTALLAAGAHGPLAPALAGMFNHGEPVPALFYRGSGVFSALLDNAPTYLLFFSLAGNDAATLTGALAPTLTAISAGTAFFGGLTYIGNAPNLMVKAIAESQGVRMPGFFGYSGWAALILVPWLLLIEAIFFR